MKIARFFGRPGFILLGVAPLFAGQAVADDGSVNLRLSVGSSYQTRNDVQTPNNEFGTRFSLADEAGEGPVTAIRLEANWKLDEKHGIRLLLAPLSYTESVVFDQPIQFEGASFEQGQPTDASYRFNSWRIGYHYTVTETEDFTFKVGGTLKVRDAEIRLEQGETTSFNDDLGLVPLLYLSAKRRFGKHWTLGADLDGLAGGPGRAIDLGVTLDYSLTNRWNIGVDARVLDGGADVAEVYNFARFNSLAFAVSTVF